jgi:ribosomal protein L11 methyltransferase
VADIGTGTGLLAFAALELWPRAYATASDIDAACVGVAGA